ncbi:antitoxin VbhA family protein [Sinorhizobium fredii]|uniref:antitoxin VbhA family protein n=1 Tax=Rhizobium fredii TaxID=380 RepID=UPI00059B663A|nr:antitoxin VbhA family protein [Sinorhizobium fredii]
MRHYADGGCAKDRLIAKRNKPSPWKTTFRCRVSRSSTPEQTVEDAVANSRLSGYEVTEDVEAVMLRIARGEMSTDQVEVWEDERGNPKVD